MTLLDNGETFPDLEIHLRGGETMHLPGDLAGGWAVVLFNRGAWCPFCTAQLRAFQRRSDDLAGLGTRLVALSADDEATTQELVDANHLTFAVGHGADVAAVAAATGAFTHDDPAYLQATGFVLAPDGTVLTAVYSSGAIGRLTAEDTVGFLRHVQGAA